VFAVRALLARTGMTIDRIGLWEMNEAFAVQDLLRDALGIPNDLLERRRWRDRRWPPLRRIRVRASPAMR
jgi:hypothetical protein